MVVRSAYNHMFLPVTWCLTHVHICTRTHVTHTHKHTPAYVLQCTLPAKKPAKYRRTHLGNWGPRTSTHTGGGHAGCLVVITSSSWQTWAATIIGPYSAFLHRFSHTASRAYVCTTHLTPVVCMHVYISICKYISGSCSN